MKRSPLIYAATIVVCCICVQARAEVVLTVGLYGTGQYAFIQQAIAAVPANSTERYIISILPGTYYERLNVPDNRPNITLHGQDPDTTIVTFDDNIVTAGNTHDTSSAFITGHDFIAENLTFTNSTPNGGGQAVALCTEGDRLIFRNCRITGWQDTLFAGGDSTPGRAYFEDCYIDGDVDFIFGNAKAYFEQCDIRSKDPGHITAQSKDSATLDSGYVFHDCTLTRMSWVPNASVSLGRPWRDYATVIYDSCWMDAHIIPGGWNNWGHPEREATSYHAEYNSTGPGANPAARVAWSHQLTAQEVEAYSLANWLGGDDNWDPTIPEPTSLALMGLGAGALLRRWK